MRYKKLRNNENRKIVTSNIDLVGKESECEPKRMRRYKRQTLFFRFMIRNDMRLL